MITVYKYYVLFNSQISIPKGAKLLKVGEQAEGLYIWAEIDTESSVLEHHFEVFGTGHEMHEDMGVERKHIGVVEKIVTKKGIFDLHK